MQYHYKHKKTGVELVDRNEAIGLCICKMCPTWNDCREEIAYCLAATGKSTCIADELGCLCPGCVVLEKE